MWPVIILLCLGLFSGSSALTSTTSGTSGTVCKAGSVLLCPLEESSCVNNRCACGDSTHGKPGLLCTDDSKRVCSITNDPVANTYNGQRADVPIPCKFLVSHVSQISVPYPAGTCDVKVYAHNKRIAGKFYAQGVEAHVSYTPTGATTATTRGFKMDGAGHSGVYTYNMYVANDIETSNYVDTWNEADYRIESMPFVFEVDPDSNRVKLDVPICKLTLQFRAVDEDENVHNQIGLPGLAVAVDNDGALDGANTICMNLQSVSDFLPYNRGIMSELIRRAYASNATQDFAGASDECSLDVLGVCKGNEEKMSEALNDCSEIWENPLFVNCFSGTDDPKSDRVLSLFRVCMDSSCRNLGCSDDLAALVNSLDAECAKKLPNHIQGLSC